MKVIQMTGKPPRHVLRQRVASRAMLASDLRISFRGVAYSCEVSEAEALDLLLEERSDYGQKQYEEGFREGLRQARFGSGRCRWRRPLCMSARQATTGESDETIRSRTE